MLQITSASGPFRNARLACRAASVLARVVAMGLLPANEQVKTLDLAAIKRALRHVHQAGIGRAIQIVDGYSSPGRSLALELALDQLNAALEESPAPEYEWNRLAEILGIDLLSGLLGISSSSVRRYLGAARATPDDVAVRLHLLTVVVGDLSGAYNEIGARRWFDRKRTQLGGRAPRELLSGAWDSNAQGPQKVRELARSLTASPAT